MNIIEDDFPLSGLTQYHVSVLCMTIKCLEGLTLDENKWLTIEDFYNELNTHSFAYQDIQNNKYYKFTLENLKYLMPMIAYMGMFDKKEENNCVYFKKNNTVDVFTLALKHNLHKQ